MWFSFYYILLLLILTCCDTDCTSLSTQFLCSLLLHCHWLSLAHFTNFISRTLHDHSDDFSMKIHLGLYSCQIVASCLGDCDKIIQVSTYCLVRDSPVQLGTSNRRYAEQHQDEAFTCNHYHIRTSTVMSGDNIIFETHELLVRFNSNLK